MFPSRFACSVLMVGTAALAGAPVGFVDTTHPVHSDVKMGPCVEPNGVSGGASSDLQRP